MDYSIFHNRNILAAAEKLAPSIHVELQLEEMAAKADFEKFIASARDEELRFSLGLHQPFSTEVVQAAKAAGVAAWNASVLEMLVGLNRMGAVAFVKGRLEINPDRIQSYHLPWL